MTLIGAGMMAITVTHPKTTIYPACFVKKNYVTEESAVVKEENLLRHDVHIFKGIASFEDPHKIKIKGEKEEIIQGKFILIASGSYPFHPENIPFDGKRVHDSDTILDLKRIPKSLCIVGAGVIG